MSASHSLKKILFKVIKFLITTIFQVPGELPYNTYKSSSVVWEKCCWFFAVTEKYGIMITQINQATLTHSEIYVINSRGCCVLKSGDCTNHMAEGGKKHPAYIYIASNVISSITHFSSEDVAEGIQDGANQAAWSCLMGRPIWDWPCRPWALSKQGWATTGQHQLGRPGRPASQSQPVSLPQKVSWYPKGDPGTPKPIPALQRDHAPGTSKEILDEQPCCKPGGIPWFCLSWVSLWLHISGCAKSRDPIL
jgi:hypothetical protein